MKAIKTFAKYVVTLLLRFDPLNAKERRGMLPLQGYLSFHKEQHRPLVLTLVILFSTISERAVACTCRGAEEPPCVAYQKADAVFVGFVVDITEAPLSPGNDFKELFVHFSVERRLKGVSEEDLKVATITGTDCDIGFKVGEQYLVFAYRESQHNRLTTGICTRTKQLSRAEEDLAYVREITASIRGSSISGRDGRSVKSLLEGVNIVIEGQVDEYKAVADSKGAFKVELARPGRYKITLVGPSELEFLTNHSSWRVFSVNGRPAVEFETIVSENECNFIDFSLFIDVRRK
jgi:hypothetical protein